MFFASSLFVSLLLLWGSMDLSLTLKVTAPYEGFFWNEFEPLVVQWTSVQTDPTNFGIQISNNDPKTYPVSTNRVVATGVSATAGHYSVQGNQGLKVGSGYRINLVSQINSGILAQSATFNISAGQGTFNATTPSASASNNSLTPVVSGTNSTTANLSNSNSSIYPSVATTSAKASPAQALAVVPVRLTAACFLILLSLCCF